MEGNLTSPGSPRSPRSTVTRSEGSRSDPAITPTTIPTTMFGAMDKSSRSLGDSKLRTMGDIREQVAQELAFRILSKAPVVEGVKLAVSLTLSKKDDGEFLRQVASNIEYALISQRYMFAVATTGSSTKSTWNTLMLCGSETIFLQRAAVHVCSKFMTRVQDIEERGNIWTMLVRDMGTSSYDEKALWDVVRKASLGQYLDPAVPPKGSRGIDQILSDARTRLQRLTATQAYEELHDPDYPMPTMLVDIRPQSQRDADGSIDGCLVIERNHLEWRFDPRCEARHAIATRYDLRVIIFCQEGYTSSLAAASLHDIGQLNATDIVGGFAAWKAAGLPMMIKPPPLLSSIMESSSPLPSQLSLLAPKAPKRL